MTATPHPAPVSEGGERYPAVELMARETRVTRGQVPHELDGQPVPDGRHWLSGDSFLLRAVGDVGIFYHKGQGITVEQPPTADPRDIALLLNGTAYAAVAAINGLMPLHASAVAHDGRVYAFTGAPGAGKSTLAAGLGRHGLPLFCDDTLILDLSSGAAIVCLPGHKRLKLWPAGVALAAADAQEFVGSDYPKHFAQPIGGVVTEPLALAQLSFLEPAETPSRAPIAAGEHIARLQDDHYTARLFERAGRLTRTARFAQLAAIAARLPMERLGRPFNVKRFDEGLRFVADGIREARR